MGSRSGRGAEQQTSRNMTNNKLKHLICGSAFWLTVRKEGSCGGQEKLNTLQTKIICFKVKKKKIVRKFKNNQFYHVCYKFTHYNQIYKCTTD